MNLRLSLLSSFCLTASIGAQSITLAEGNAASLDVVTVPESNPTAAPTVLLSAVEFLPMEISGRTVAQAGDPARCRLVDRHGLSRVELTDGGRLLKYRRNGGSHYGYLHVARNGDARVVLEMLADPGMVDPFGDRIGVARDARYAAVVRNVGGLFVVRLDGLVFPSTGTSSRLVAPADVIDPQSVMVGKQVVWFQDTLDHVLRCGLADGSVPVDISPPPLPNPRLKPQMAMSGNGERVVYVYGDHAQTQQQLFTATANGPSVLLPMPPAKYEEAGYLPEEPGEPAMLLDEAGRTLFCVRADIRDELFLLDLEGVLPTIQITEDAIFQPYIGVHVIPSFIGRDLTIAIGDPNQMDWFRAKMTPAGAQVANLTGTGSLLQPFPSGQLDPRTSTTVRGSWFAVENQGAGQVLRRISQSTGATAVVATGLAAAPMFGDSLSAAHDIVVSTVAGDQLLIAATGALAPTFFVPAPFGFEPPASGPLFSAVQVTVPGGWSVPVFYLPDGQAALGALEVGLEQIALTAGGGAVLNGATVRYVAPGVAVQLNLPVVPMRRLLSGVGV